jgi:hypothetical protein
MPTIEIKVQRISFISDSPFDEIVKTLTATIGCPDMTAFHNALPRGYRDPTAQSRHYTSTGEDG